MPYGVGGLLGDLFHPDLNAQLGRAISPNPLPSPTPQPGAAPGPTGAPGAGSAAQGPQGAGTVSNVAPIQLPASDPVNQQSIGELLLNAQRERDAEQGLNYGLHEIAAGFGTAQQQASKQANLRNYPQSGDNLISQLQGIQGIQGTQFEQQQQQQYQAALEQYFLSQGKSPEEARLLSHNLPLATSLITPTTTMKDVDAYGKEYAASKGYDPDPSKWTKEQRQDVESAKANAQAGALGGTDLETRQYLQEKQAGLTTDDFATWKAKKAAQGKMFTDQAQDLAEAQKSAPGMLTKIDEAERLVNQLKSDPASLDAALKFMSTPLFNQGPDQAVKAGLISQKTYDAIAAIQQLSGQVYGQGFASTGSKRTQQEVAAIVSGLSQLKNVGYSGSDYIKNALNPLQTQFDKARANGLGAAQRLDEIPVNQRGLVDPSYLPGGALYNGKGGAWAKDIELSSDEETAAHSMIDSGQATREQVRQHILSEGKRPPSWLANG